MEKTIITKPYTYNTVLQEEKHYIPPHNVRIRYSNCLFKEQRLKGRRLSSPLSQQVFPSAKGSSSVPTVINHVHIKFIT